MVAVPSAPTDRSFKSPYPLPCVTTYGPCAANPL